MEWNALTDKYVDTSYQVENVFKLKIASFTLRSGGEEKKFLHNSFCFTIISVEDVKLDHKNQEPWEPNLEEPWLQELR